MSAYLLINIIIISVPLALTFVPRFKFHRKLLPLSLSILIVGGSFLLWDILVTARGDWAFNEIYVGSLRIFGIPLEEVLFFITVPYSCIFLYEGLVFFLNDRKIWHKRNFYFTAAGVFFLTALAVVDKEYTFLASIAAGLLFLCAALFFKDMFSSLLYWIWIGMCTVLFMVFNYFLTSLPVVIYNPAAILNIRIISIPIEDFFYNFAMLSFYLGIYLFFKKLKFR